MIKIKLILVIFCSTLFINLYASVKEKEYICNIIFPASILTDSYDNRHKCKNANGEPIGVISVCGHVFPDNSDDRLKCIYSHNNNIEKISVCGYVFPDNSDDRLKCVNSGDTTTVIRVCGDMFTDSNSHTKLQCIHSKNDNINNIKYCAEEFSFPRLRITCINSIHKKGSVHIRRCKTRFANSLDIINCMSK